MKQTKSDGSGEQKALTRCQCEQLIDGVEADGARYQFAVRVFWLILGTACAAVGWVLLSILVR
jgi:hypothetical protein